MRKRIWLLAFIGLLGLVVLARDALLTKGVEVYVSRKMTAQGWVFESIEREKNRLTVKNLSHQSSSGKTLVEKADALFHISLFPLQLQPTVDISRLVIDISPNQPSDDSFVGLLFCLGDSRLDLKLSIEEGEVSGVLEKPFAFSFKPGLEKKEMGTLSLKDLEKNTFLSTHLKWQGESLVSKVEIDKGSASDLMILASFMQNSALKGWTKGQGEVSASITSRFHPQKGLEEMKGNLDLENISFFHPDLKMHFFSESLKGTLLFSPDALKEENLSFWKKVELFLTFEDANLRIDQKEIQLGLEEALGEMRLTPQEDPYLKMVGKILSKNLSIPFEVEGKGQLSDKGAFWLQTQADFFLPKRDPHFFMSFSQNEQEESTLQVDCAQFSPEIFNIVQLAFPLFHLPECRMQVGMFEGKFVGAFEKGQPKTLTFSECSAEDLVLAIPSENLLLKSQSISFSGSLEKGEKGLLELNSLASEIRKVDLLLQDKEIFRALSAKVGVHLGEFLSSYAEGFHQGIWGSVQVLDPTAKDLLHLECKAFSSDLMRNVWGEQASHNQANPIFLALDVSNQEGKAQGNAVIRLISPAGIEEDIDVQVSLDRNITRNVRDLFSKWDFSSCQGFFKTEKLSSETGSIWVRPWLGALSLEGFLKGEGRFDGKGVSMDVSQVDFNLTGGNWDVSAKLGCVEKNVHVTYEYKEGIWKGSVPVDFLHLQNNQLNLEAHVQNSLFFFEGDKLWTEHIEADALGAKLMGKLLIDKSGVHIASKAFEGTLLSLNPLTTRYAPQMASLGLNGMFSVEDRGCLIEGKKQGDEWTWDWKASVNLKDLACDLGKMGKVQQGRGCLEGNASGDYNLKDFQGLYSLALASCPFALSDFHWSSRSSSPSDFSFLAKDSKREWMYLHGKVEKKIEGVIVSLSPHCHMLGLAMDVAPFMITSQFAVSPIQFSSNIKLEQLSSYVTMWKEMGLPSFKSSLLDACRGTVQLQAIYDLQKAQWKASFKSSEISYLQNVIGKASGTLLGEGKRIKIDSCQVGSWSAKGSLDFEKAEWDIPSLSIEWPEGKCAMKGKYNPTSAKLNIPAFSAALAMEEMGNVQLQGSFEGSYVQEMASLQGKGTSRVTAFLPPSFGVGIESMKDVPFIFDSKRGIQVEKSQWELTSLGASKRKIGKVTAKTMAYVTGEKRFVLQGGAISIPKEAYKTLQNLPALSSALKEVQVGQEIDIEGDLDFSSQGRKISGSIKNGSYIVRGLPFDVKQTKFLLEKEDVYVSCQTKCQEEPLWLQLQMKLGSLPSACLLVKEHPEKKGLVIQLKNSVKEGWFCETVQGGFKGITLQMQKVQKNAYDLQVSADLSLIPTLLPKAWAANMKKWGLGQGYSFQGSLVLDPSRAFHVQSLKGDLVGESFEFLGKSFDALNAKLDFGADKGRIHSLKLEDEIANLSIKTVDFCFNPKIQSWDITSPLVYVKDFAPALFLKGRKERGMEIKNLSLYDFKGTLNSLDSFEAKGALFFSSLEKKEFSFWDVPLGLMKDWGLDPGILTPVTGEADFVLRRGCFYFTALRNVYSEGKRSQFYLAEAGNDSYLALDGSWHVDLAMKQNVVWKVTEDLVLSIRGTVEKPKYSFKSNKKSY